MTPHSTLSCSILHTYGIHTHTLPCAAHSLYTHQIRETLALMLYIESSKFISQYLWKYLATLKLRGTIMTESVYQLNVVDWIVMKICGMMCKCSANASSK